MAVERQSLINKDAQSAPIPQAPWAVARPSRRDPSRRLPQAIAHRGAKIDWPENTMAAFRGAVGAGAHAIETDVHLSADGVAVLSHDPSLKRCFGIDILIAECTWEYLSTLRTVAEPHEPMPRLKDFLEWLTQPQLEKIWAVLDIKASKLDDDPTALMAATARALDSVQGPAPWEQRIVLGCWNVSCFPKLTPLTAFPWFPPNSFLLAADISHQASFLQAAHSQLPTYSLAHISTSLLYSHHFLRVPNLGFNLNHKTLIGPSGKLFLRELRQTDKLVLTWTVNEPGRMEWCIRQNLGQPRNSNRDTDGPALIDGVITDNPRLYLEVCDKFEDEIDGKFVRPKLALTQMARKKVETVVFVILTETLMVAYHFLRRMQGKFDFLRDRQSLNKR
ncbi:glycerophosphoryl diester phosphodiesterase [Fusarium austroafricanum]|uniref:Glycerophosphoryl diester phosphodiesterase n=1 Tax=Fusarium austroafricanum TaxID=2364996 RepID=A0A8H4KT11_9HYPO|nr:glycerophosphoryl diester phosphodiesterase [Fusarium austroafricanum]